MEVDANNDMDINSLLKKALELLCKFDYQYGNLCLYGNLVIQEPLFIYRKPLVIWKPGYTGTSGYI